MKGHFYHKSIRKYSLLMANLLGNIYVQQGGKYRKVPVTTTSKEQFIASLNSNELHGDGSLAKVSTILPRIGIQLVAVTYASTRKTNPSNRQLQRKSDSDRPTLNSQFNAVPYDLEFEVSVYTRHQDDAFQIVEQILPYFTPDFNTMIRELNENELVIDERDISIALESVIPEQEIEGAAGDMRRIEWTFTFRLQGWMYPPTNQAFGEIRTIYLDFNEEEQVIINADRESVEGNLDVAYNLRKSSEYPFEFNWRPKIGRDTEITWNRPATVVSEYTIASYTRGISVKETDITWTNRFIIDKPIDIAYQSGGYSEATTTIAFETGEPTNLQVTSFTDLNWINRFIAEQPLDIVWGQDAVESELGLGWAVRKEEERHTAVNWGRGGSVESTLGIDFTVGDFVLSTTNIASNTRESVFKSYNWNYLTLQEAESNTTIGFRMRKVVSSLTDVSYGISGDVIGTHQISYEIEGDVAPTAMMYDGDPITHDGDPLEYN